MNKPKIGRALDYSFFSSKLLILKSEILICKTGVNRSVNVCISISDRCTVLLVSVTTTTTRVRFPTRSTTTCGSSCVRFSSSEMRLARNSSLYRSYRHCSTKITVRFQISLLCQIQFTLQKLQTLLYKDYGKISDHSLPCQIQFTLQKLQTLLYKDYGKISDQLAVSDSVHSTEATDTALQRLR